MKPYILVVDDEPDIRELVRDILEDEGYSVAVAEDGAAARRAIKLRRPELVLLDIWMPDVDGITLLGEMFSDMGLTCPVVMMSGHGTVETAVEATRLGAADYIEKPLSLAKLLATVEKALAAGGAPPTSGATYPTVPLEEPVGKSVVMAQLRSQLERAAHFDVPVLLTGERGVGKSFCARYLHASGAHKNGPYVDTRGLSLDEPQAVTLLFGQEDGALVRPGLFDQARGGTLYLTDPADLHPTAQARLVGLLETGHCLRHNGRTSVDHRDVRIVVATHHVLAHDVRAGQLREDLYQRLNALPVPVPALRQHSEDIPELLQDIVARCVDRDGLPYRTFTVAAQNRLRNHGWPGNIRELKNLVRRLLILGAEPEIGVVEVEAALEATQPLAPPDLRAEFDVPLREARELFEKAYLEYHLRRSGGSVGKVAQASGLERTHLYRKLRALGIDAKQLGKD